MDVKLKEAQRTRVTAQDQLAEVVADLRDVGLVALDLETTGLNPRKDSIRLLSLATRKTTYIVDRRSVDPAGYFCNLEEVTVVAYNALFDLRFLSSLGRTTWHEKTHPTFSCALATLRYPLSISLIGGR